MCAYIYIYLHIYICIEVYTNIRIYSSKPPRDSPEAKLLNGENGRFDDCTEPAMWVRFFLVGWCVLLLLVGCVFSRFCLCFFPVLFVFFPGFVCVFLG